MTRTSNMRQIITVIAPCFNEEAVWPRWFKPLTMATTMESKLREVQRMTAPRYLMGAAVGQCADIND